MGEGGFGESLPNLSISDTPEGIPTREVWTMSVDEGVVKRGAEKLKNVLMAAEDKVRREFKDAGLEVKLEHYLEDAGRTADLNKGLSQSFVAEVESEKWQALVKFFDSGGEKHVPIETLLLLDRQAFSESDKAAMYTFLRISGGDRLAHALGERISRVSSLEGLKKFKDNLAGMIEKRILPKNTFMTIESMVAGRVLNLVQLELAPKVGRGELTLEELEQYVDRVMDWELWSDPKKGGGPEGKAAPMSSLGVWIVDGMREAVDQGMSKRKLTDLINILQQKKMLNDDEVSQARLVLKVS